MRTAAGELIEEIEKTASLRCVDRKQTVLLFVTHISYVDKGE